MVFFVYQSKLCMATLVFYKCIYSPLLQVKGALFSILGFILLECFSDRLIDVDSRETCSIDLLTGRYGDLKNNIVNADHGDDDDNEACSVCLAEFESEDMVSQLSKCGHVFHMECIDKWVERNQFTCPLCRSSFLNVHGSHATCNSTMMSCISG